MKKIIFIEPPPTINWKPSSKISKAGRRHPCLNETGEQTYSYQNLSCAAVLRENNFSIEYFHCPTLKWDINKTKNEIKRSDPYACVIMVEHITSNVTEILCSYIKSLGIINIWVGPFATSLHDELIKKDCVDYILKREWDYTVLDLINCLINKKDLNKISGLTWKDNKKIHLNNDQKLIENLDSLPIPAYDLIDLNKFYESVFIRFPAATMITSRGCPNYCVFCSYPQTIYGRKFRAMSPERVLKEIKYLVNKFGVKEIRIDDDTFNIDIQRSIEICKLIVKEKLDFVFSIQARAHLMTEELAKWLKKAGCRMVLFGVESGSDEILKKMKKNTTKDEIRKGVKIAKKYGIDVLNSVMLGFYWDTQQSVEQTIQFAFELNAEFTQMSVPTPLPGTEYYKLLEDNNCFLSKEWHKHDSVHNASVQLPHLKNDDLNRYLDEFYRRYYRRPRYILMMFLRMFRSWGNFTQSLRKFNVLFTK